MKLYRFSPIKNEQELLRAVEYTHFACHKLCKQAFGKYFPVAGNIGIFCHFDDEYDYLIRLRKKLTDESKSVFGKYFLLYEPIVLSNAIYTHLYIRKPDETHPQVGDVDFYLKPDEYKKLKQSMISGKHYAGAQIFDRGDLDMIELKNPVVDALAYVRTDEKLTILVK